VKVINDLLPYYTMTVLYLPIVDEQDEEYSTISYEAIQNIFMVGVSEMKFQDDKDSQTTIR